MKKLVSLLLVLLMCFSLAACGDSGSSGANSGSNANANAGGSSDANAGGSSDANANAGAVVDDALKPLANLYNELATLYNDAFAAAEENGWTEDEQTALELSAVGVTLGGIGAGLEDPSMLEGVDTDELVAQLEQLKPAMEDLIGRVSVPYAG